jgi:hypothetical protein
MNQKAEPMKNTNRKSLVFWTHDEEHAIVDQMVNEWRKEPFTYPRELFHRANLVLPEHRRRRVAAFSVRIIPSIAKAFAKRVHESISGTDVPAPTEPLFTSTQALGTQ